MNKPTSEPFSAGFKPGSIKDQCYQAIEQAEEKRANVKTDHAKAELALRYLEFAWNLDLEDFTERSKKSIEKLTVRCWDVVEEYFQP